MRCLAESLSLTHTQKCGHRSLDILHVTPAAHLCADGLCTLDSLQADWPGPLA